MTIRHVLEFVVVGLVMGGVTACGDSEGDGETNQTTGSPTNSSDGGSGGGAGTDTTTTGTTGTTTTTTGTTTTTPGTTTSGDDGTGTSEPTDNPNPGFCPDEQPEAGAECMVGFPAACTYAEVGCVCGDGVWDCYSASDCPAAAPADGDGCDLNGMACSYDGLGCSCDTPA